MQDSEKKTSGHVTYKLSLSVSLVIILATIFFYFGKSQELCIMGFAGIDSEIVLMMQCSACTFG